MRACTHTQSVSGSVRICTLGQASACISVDASGACINGS